MDLIGALASINKITTEQAWDLSNYTFQSNFSISAQETGPNGLFFKPDGTKMYITGSACDDVNEYNLSSAWDITSASYVQNFSPSAQDGFPTGVFFKPDGTVMYLSGNSNNIIIQYSLSTAWDISTASYVQSFSVATQDTTPSGVFFKSDGLKMYVIGTNNDAIYEYDLSSAWDISTASYVQSFSVAAQDTSPRGIFFKPDGTKMYHNGDAGNDINEYSLSTAWNISTASFTQNLSVSASDTTPTGLFFKDDGEQLYFLGSLNDRVYSYAI
jgi:sugar lactone lactonase YvrE